MLRDSRGKNGKYCVLCFDELSDRHTQDTERGLCVPCGAAVRGLIYNGWK